MLFLILWYYDHFSRLGTTCFISNDIKNIRRIRTVDEARRVRLYDTSFMCSNLFDGIAKKRLMVFADICDHRSHWILYDIGGIFSATQTNFDNSKVNLFPCENCKSCRSQQLEFGRLNIIGDVPVLDLLFNRAEVAFLHDLLVDSDTVPSIHQMR